MTENRLSEIRQMGQDGSAGTAEVVELLTEFFLSSSRHSKAIREAQAEAAKGDSDLAARLSVIEAKLSSIERLLRHPFSTLDIVERGDADEDNEEGEIAPEEDEDEE